MENKFIKIEKGNEMISVNVDDIPDIISSRVDNISKLENKVRNAEKSSNVAMEYVSNMTCYKEKGKGVFKHRSGNTKDIIESSQQGIEQLAKAQQVSVNALRQSFNFQKELANASKYLFDLGCANITVNRIAVRAIELKLSGASKETLSDLAKQEMLNVVKQLKEQEDILKKQEFLNSKLKEHSLRLDGKDHLDEAQSRKIETLDLENKDHYRKIFEIKDTLTNKNKIDEEQTQRLEELMALLKNKDLIDKKQESTISENRAIIEKNSDAIRILTEYTNQKDVIDKEQSNEISSLKNAVPKKLFIMAIIMSSVSLIVSIASGLLLFLR